MPSNLAGKPTRGDCTFPFAFRIGQGRHGGVGLNWDDATGRNNGRFAPFTWQG